MPRSFSVTGFLPLLVYCCALAWAGSAFAAERTFNLAEVVDFGVQHNGDLKALREEKGIREAAKVKASLYPNPLLELNGATGAATGSPSESSISLSVSQEFLTAGKREKRVQAADRESQSFNWQIADRERLLKEELKRLFLDYLLLKRRVDLAERSIALNRQLLEVTKERLAAGDIPEMEVDLAKVEVSRSEGKRTDVERDLKPTILNLASLMGLRSGEEAEFTGSLDTNPVATTLEDIRKLALTNRPDLKALVAEQAKGDADIALAKAEGIPNVTAGIELSRESTSIEVGDAEGRSRDYLIGMKLSIPIPIFDRNQAGIREAHARKSSAETRYLFARASIEREVDAAYARLISSEKALSIYSKDIMPQLDENLKIVQEAYRLGEVGILTVIEEQKKFFEVNDGYLTALHDRQAAMVKLEAVVGVDLGMAKGGGEK